MLQNPNLPVDGLIAHLREAYAVRAIQLDFLPIGADSNAIAYRAVTEDGKSYFVKLKRGTFDETTLALTRFLNDHGIMQVIAPIATQTGQLWASWDVFCVMLYPFIEGHNGFEVVLTDCQWFDFGAALKAIHTTALPSIFMQHLSRETFSPQWRDAVVRFLEPVAGDALVDTVAVKLAAFLKVKRNETLDLVRRAERLA
ncbi:MAG TPA: phosphotransferase, partial [Anaerolineae bacterium]